MRFVILAGGFGTRLGNMNKALIELPNGKPLIEYITTKIFELNPEKPVIVMTNVHYAYEIWEWCESFNKDRKKVVLFIEPSFTPSNRLETVSSIRYIMEFIEDDLYIIFVDNFFTFRLPELWKDCPGICCAIVKVPKKNIKNRLGNVLPDEKGNVLRFEEKPDKPFSDYALTGILFIRNNENIRSVMDEFIEKFGSGSFGRFFKYVVENYPELVKVLTIDGQWLDVGTPETLKLLEKVSV